MNRVFTATSLAALFAVGLAAQTPTSGTASQDPQTAGGGRANGPRTVTGCLRAGDTAGTYMLTDVQMARPGGDTTTAGGTTAGGTTAGGTTAGGTTAGTAGGTTAGTAGTGATAQGNRPTSLMLSTTDTTIDLKAHVGHKIEVTGTMAGGGRRGGDTTSGTGAGTGTAGTGTATATGTGTTAGTAGGTTTGAATGQGQGRGGPRNMTVTSVRMISESCS